MKKLQSLISYFVFNLSHSPGKTELVKLCYLFEYLHTLLYGVQYTETQFIRYHYGPYSYDFDSSVTHLVNSGIVMRDESYYAEGKKSIHYYPKNTLLQEQYNITEDKALLAEYIIDTYYELSLETLLNDVYNSAPMLKIKQKEEEFGMGLMLREALDMNEFNDTIKISKEELIAARARRNKQENRGADKDYFAHLSSQYKELEDLRRRAEECQM